MADPATAVGGPPPELEQGDDSSATPPASSYTPATGLSKSQSIRVTALPSISEEGSESGSNSYGAARTSSGDGGESDGGAEPGDPRWHRYFDEKYCRVYYFSHATSTTIWELPPDVTESDVVDCVDEYSSCTGYSEETLTDSCYSSCSLASSAAMGTQSAGGAHHGSDARGSDGQDGDDGASSDPGRKQRGRRKNSKPFSRLMELGASLKDRVKDSDFRRVKDTVHRARDAAGKIKTKTSRRYKDIRAGRTSFGGALPTAVFGVTIPEAAEVSSVRVRMSGRADLAGLVPIVVLDAVSYLESKHAELEVGIFRVPASARPVRNLRAIYDAGGDALLEERLTNVHVVAALLTEFLRDMQGSIVSDDARDGLEAIAADPSLDRESRTAALRDAVLHIPPAYRATACFICDYLRVVVADSDTNLMNRDNLRRLFANKFQVSVPLFDLMLSHGHAFLGPPSPEEEVLVATYAAEAREARMAALRNGTASPSLRRRTRSNPRDDSGRPKPRRSVSATPQPNRSLRRAVDRLDVRETSRSKRGSRSPGGRPRRPLPKIPPSSDRRRTKSRSKLPALDDLGGGGGGRRLNGVASAAAAVAVPVTGFADDGLDESQIRSAPPPRLPAMNDLGGPRVGGVAAAVAVPVTGFADDDLDEAQIRSAPPPPPGASLASLPP